MTGTVGKQRRSHGVPLTRHNRASLEQERHCRTRGAFAELGATEQAIILGHGHWTGSGLLAERYFFAAMTMNSTLTSGRAISTCAQARLGGLSLSIH